MTSYQTELVDALREGLRVLVTRDGVELSEGQIEERARNLVQAGRPGRGGAAVRLYRILLPFGGRLVLEDVDAWAFVGEAARFYGVSLLATPFTPGMGRYRMVRS